MENVAAKSDEKQSKEEKMKSLMKELGAKPYVKKFDGKAVKVDEDKEIEYEDYDGNTNILKVPAGCYMVLEGDGWCPKCITAEDFEKKFGFVEQPKKKKEKSPVSEVKIGISSIDV